MLEKWQHQALKARAEREGKSISALVREILTQELQRERPRGKLSDIRGIASGDGPPLSNEEMDRIIYDIQ